MNGFENDIYLKLHFAKSEAGGEGLGRTDEDGNYIFEVEASNENLDLQNQVVLQRALLESKDEFLRSGVISNDHQHRRRNPDGTVDVDNSMIIGEPIDVKTDGKRTIVVGKLYKSNKWARDFIRLLKDKSTRVRASVGGIFPKIVHDAKTGVEKITHVLWNDLALTCSPVNNTVGYASFAKSLDSAEFVRALTATCGTDNAKKDGGGALVPEDVGVKAFDAAAEKAGVEGGADDGKDEVLRRLSEGVKAGEFETEEDAIGFLTSNGFNGDEAQEVALEIKSNGGFSMKKSISERVKGILKSFAKSDGGEPDLFNRKGADSRDGGKGEIDLDEEDGVEKADPDDEDEADLDDADDEDEADLDDADEDEDGDDDGDEVVDATEFVKSIARENARMRKSIDDLGGAVVALSRAVARMGGEKLPARSVMSKALTAAQAAKGGGRMTAADFGRAQRILCDVVAKGTISALDAEVYSSEIQKSIAMGTRISSGLADLLRANS